MCAFGKILNGHERRPHMVAAVRQGLSVSGFLLL